LWIRPIGETTFKKTSLTLYILGGEEKCVPSLLVWSRAATVHDTSTQITELQNIVPEDIEQWIKSDSTEDEQLSNEEIHQLLQETSGNQQPIDELDHDSADKEVKISHRDAVDTLTKALLYVEQQPNVTTSDILLIKRWKDIATNNLWKTKTK
jgi:hypothetical protein